MSLTRTQYDEVMRLYDRRQLEDRRIMQKRRETAYAKIPELSEIDRDVADRAVEILRNSLFPDSVLQESEAASAPVCGAAGTASSGPVSPEARKRKLLAENGFPADYLDPVYQCADCRDTGFIGHEKCHCFRQAVISLFYTQSGLRDVLEKENFSTFSLDWYPDDLINPDTGRSSRETMRGILDDCRSFASGYDRLTKPYLLLCGESGRGKTFLSHCIAKELMDSTHSVIYYSAKDLFDRLRDLRFRSGASDSPDSRADEENRLDSDCLYTCDLLIIDDLGTELPNDFTKSAFFSLLNGRTGAGRGIIISTNLSFQDLSDIYSPRIMSRILENFQLLNLFGKDIRILKRMASG